MHQFTFLLALVLVLGLSVAAGCKPPMSQQEVKATAETNLREFVGNMGPGYRAMGCSGQDSDMNGYVSCSGLASDGTVIEFECGYKGIGVGCKPKETKVHHTLERKGR